MKVYFKLGFLFLTASLLLTEVKSSTQKKNLKEIFDKKV